MEMFLKRSYKLMFEFDVYFRNIAVITFADTVSYTPQFKHDNCAERR